MGSGTPGEDFPELKEPVDVQSEELDETVSCFVRQSDASSLLVSAPVRRTGERVRLAVGEEVNLVWRGPEELRARPAELVETVPEPEPRWRLRLLGQATRGQRRQAVRVPLALPVQTTVERVDMTGTTVDVSEGGLHCLFQTAMPRLTSPPPVAAGPAAGDAPLAAGEAPPGVATTAGATQRPAEIGLVMPVTFDLGSGQPPVRTQAEIVRVHPRKDKRAEVSVRFIDLPERDQDRIRARVFAEMRALRARGVL